MTETAPPTSDTPPTGTAPEQVWGGPVPPRPTWSTKKTLAAVAVAVVLGGCAGAAIYAAGSGSSEASGPGGFGPGGGSFGGPGGMRGMGSSQGESLHGEFVVAATGGGYTTELTQTGKVTAISATSVTAVSTDDYSHTYVIDTKTRTGSRNRSGGGTPTTITVGDTVFITATVAGDKATATSVLPTDAAGPGRGTADGGTMSGGPGGTLPGGTPPGAMPGGQGGPGGAMPGGMPPGAPPQQGN